MLHATLLTALAAPAAALVAGSVVPKPVVAGRAGHLLRRTSRWLRALHLPASVVGGLFGWLLFFVFDLVGGGPLLEEWFTVGWDVLPGFCTNIIFSALFLGTPVPSPGVILASPRREHFLYGLIVVFGQYVVSCICTIFFSIFDVPTPGSQTHDSPPPRRLLICDASPMVDSRSSARPLRR